MRVLLAADACLGVVAALLVLAQAVLLARVAARGFEGASLADVARPLELLVVVVAARAALAWGFETVGRRAAQRTLSGLRADLVDSRLRDRPAALDRTTSAEVATLAVSGVDALETTFTRYLPQLVLALVVPVAVLAIVASIDPISAGVMLLTLPLVPLFMWLVGRFTERRAQARLRALTVLSGHFLDVVRGLPTLRAFNRSAYQAERIATVSDEYRRTTMGTLRAAFLSGAILELAATLGIALVAVTVGVRLVDGGIGLEAALTVLVLAPELYLPLRNLAAQFHASADGLAVAARLLDLLEEPATRRAGTATPPSPAVAPVRLERVSFSYPSRAGVVLDGVDLELPPGQTVALVGPSGSGKSTVAALLLGFAEPSAGRLTVGRRRPGGLRPPRLARRARVGAAAADALPRDGRRQRPARRRRRVARPRPRGARARRRGRRSCAGFRTGSRPWSATAADRSRPGERQRLALARAFLRDAPLAILDEPTANLDPESAELVADAVERLSVGRTVLLIAHAPELAALADHVVELRAGRIVTPVAEAV